MALRYRECLTIARSRGRGYHDRMQPEELDSLSSELSALLARQAGARGADLAAQLKRADRLLTRRARKGGQAVVAALELGGAPKMQRMIDEHAVRRGARDLRAHLQTLQPWDRRKGQILGFLGTISAGIILITAVTVTVLVWRGYL